MLFPAMVMVGLGFMECETRLIAVFMICVADSLDAFGRAGISVNIIEVAPRYTTYHHDTRAIASHTLS